MDTEPGVVKKRTFHIKKENMIVQNTCKFKDMYKK